MAAVSWLVLALSSEAIAPQPASETADGRQSSEMRKPRRQSDASVLMLAAAAMAGLQISH